MAKQVVWSETAHADRKEILLYWAERNKSKSYSRKLFKLFQQTAALIASIPDIGSKTDFKNVRKKIVRDYLLFYREGQDQIEIIAVWDGRRDPQKLASHLK